jgi:hypothetical protein
MKKTLLISTLVLCASAVLAEPQKSTVKPPSSLSMFGVKLENANRSELRKAIDKAGLEGTSVRDNYSCDEYKVTNQIPGASKLTVCYASKDKQAVFAQAFYTFGDDMSFDVPDIHKILAMVESKYGQPSKSNNRFSLGSFDAYWNFNQNEYVELYRPWPDPEVYLLLTDTPNFNLLNKQNKERKAAQAKADAQKSSNAF